MANEMGGSPGDTSNNDASPFDVKDDAPIDGTGNYEIPVDEIEHEEGDEPDEPQVNEPPIEGPLRPTPREGQQRLDHPVPGATRKVPAFFPPKMIPKGIRFPMGIEALFIRIRAEWTSARHKGDRFLIMWGTTEADEKLAAGRCMGDNNRIQSELAKQTIRAVDGHVADWSGLQTPGSTDQLWREIGPKGRNLLTRLMVKTNVLMESELTDFFENCIAAVPTG